jgi:hypothetical protein
VSGGGGDWWHHYMLKKLCGMFHQPHPLATMRGKQSFCLKLLEARINKRFINSEPTFQ